MDCMIIECSKCKGAILVEAKAHKGTCPECGNAYEIIEESCAKEK